jgi:hypothetical protein
LSLKGKKSSADADHPFPLTSPFPLLDNEAMTAAQKSCSQGRDGKSRTGHIISILVPDHATSEKGIQRER